MLSWEAVALIGLIFGFVVAMAALRRKEGRFAGKDAHERLAADFNAFTRAVEARDAQTQETLKRLEVRTTEGARNRLLPPGLRQVP